MYTGQRAIYQLGAGGFDGNSNIYRVPITNLVQAVNIRFFGDSLQKSPGLNKFNSIPVSGLPTCLAGFDWHPLENIQRQVTAWDNGEVYKSASDTIDVTTLVTGLTFSEPITFIAGDQQLSGNDRKLYLYHKGIEPHVLLADGITMAPIANPSVDWTGTNQPASAVYHDARTVAFGAPDAPYLLYFSEIDDHGDFADPTLPLIDIYPGEFERIAACFSYLPQRLYVFKYPYGIYWVDTTDIGTPGAFIPVSVVRKDVGMAGPHGVTRAGNDVLFIASNGHIYSLTAVESSEDIRDADVTANLNLEGWIQQNVNLNRLDHARLHYDDGRKELWAIFSKKDSDVNNIGLVIDLSIPNLPRISTEDRGSYFEAMWNSQNDNGTLEILTAGTGGHVYRANAENRAIGATIGYTGKFETPASDLGWVNPAFAKMEKRFDYLEFLINPTGDYDLTVEIYIDGILYLVDSVNLVDPNGTPLDEFILDSDTLGGNTIVTKKIRIAGHGNRIGILCKNSGTNENFNISEMTLYFEPLGTQGVE